LREFFLVDRYFLVIDLFNNIIGNSNQLFLK
jgi:hypothetical protein